MSRVEVADEEPYPNAWALQERARENFIKGKKGQAVLKELEEALLALPQKRLIGSQFCADGEVCTLGALAVHREVKAGKDRAQILKELAAEAAEWHEEDNDDQALEFAEGTLNLAHSFAWYVVYKNDEFTYKDPQERYEKILAWVQRKIIRPAAEVPV